MVLALVLRLYRLDFQSLWIDEILTVRSSELPLARILFDPAVDRNFPPLHNVLVHLTMLAAGEHEAAIRMPSVVAGVLAVPLLYGIARAWLPAAVALGAAGLLAVSPLHVWYGQEARPYAIFVTLGLAALWFVQRQHRRPGAIGSQIGFVLSATGFLYTHLLALPFLGFLALYALGRAPSWERRRWLVLFGIVVLLASPQLYDFLNTPPTVSANRGYRFNPVHLGYTVWAFAVGYSLGPSLLELRQGMPAVLAHLGVMLPVLALVAALGIAGAVELWRRHRAVFWSVAAWMAFPVGFAVFGAAASDHPYNVRYVLLALPAFLLVVAATACMRAPVVLRWGGLGLLAVISLVSLAGYYTQPRYQREDNRAAVAFLNSVARPGELVIVSAPYTTLALGHYGLRPDLVVRTYPRRGSVVDPDRVDEELAALCRGHRRLWLYLSRTFHSDRGDLVPAFFERRLTPVQEHVGAGVRVVAYAAGEGGTAACEA